MKQIVRIILFITLLQIGMTVCFAEDLSVFYDDKTNKSGFKDTDGKIVIPAQFDVVDSWFTDGITRAKINEKWGLIDEKGNFVVSTIYDYIARASDSTWVYKNKGKYGFLKNNGDVLIPARFDFAGEMSENSDMALIQVDKKYGYVNKSGKVVIPPKYDKGMDFNNGCAKVKLNNQWGVVDASGKFFPGFYQNYYDGLIDNKYPILLSLTMSNNTEFMGEYNYKSRMESLFLQGHVTEGQGIELTEISSDKTTGSFQGKWDSSHSKIEGQWKNADGTKSFPFTLKKIADGDTYISEGIQIDYPIFTAFDPSVNAQLNTRVQDAIQKELQPLGSDSEGLSLGYSEYGFSTYQDEYAINNYSDNYISLQSSSDWYDAGAAHPNHNKSFLNYAIVSSKVKTLKLADLFLPKSDYQKVIIKMVRDDLTRQQASWPKEVKLDHWTIQGKSLVFSFDPYAVGSYAEGFYTVVIPFSKIKTLLNPESPVRGL